MVDICLKSIAKAVGGKLLYCSEEQSKLVCVNQVVIDSRKVKPCMENNKNSKVLFVAIKGDHSDGNDYAKATWEAGAVAAIVSHEIISETPFPQIVVEDTCVALKNLAAFYREYFEIPFIGITGSTGKTSTKEMIASVLAEQFKVHKTMLNFNNEIGLPLTILELDKENEVSVLEMGMDKFGEIECLAEISKPSIGVITNIGTAHIENLGTRDNILKAKMEITTWFDEKSVLVINADDEYLSKISQNNYVLKRVSIYNRGDYNAVDIQSNGEAGVDFKCTYRGQMQQFNLRVPGKHNVYNALMAIAIADLFDMDIEKIKCGIENYRPVGQRMNIIDLKDNIKLINDCYNANPDSMKAALNVLEGYENRRRIAILGDMYELGAYTEEAHTLIGNYLENKCDLLVAVGDSASYMFEAAKDKVESKYYKTKEEASAYVKSILKTNDVVLIKASRGMKMEDITNSLIKVDDDDDDDDDDGKKGKE
jgi:UDP-N-acetylmuramoyl-tripeptide--D-alanyl-D-alanine ligase